MSLLLIFSYYRVNLLGFQRLGEIEIPKMADSRCMMAFLEK